MKKLQNQHGGAAIILISIAVIIGAIVWYLVKYTNKHPETTEQVVPAQTVEQGSKTIQDAKQLQNKYQPPAQP